MSIQIEQLVGKGYVSLSYPLDLRKSVENTVESWKRFCELSTEIKASLPYSNGADGVGYELKEGKGNRADRKENFDVTIAGQEWLEKNIQGIKNDTALEFVQNATALVSMMKPIVLDFAKALQEFYQVDGFYDEVESGEDAFFVRFIHYFGDREIGDETATAHVDQSGFTLHLYESASGLQCMTYDDKKWVDMPVSSGETVIIPAMQLQLRSEGKLKALFHRVVATPETSQSGRYSAVCFVQLKQTPKYDKEKCGRLQEKEPGFNYELSLEDFARYFKN